MKFLRNLLLFLLSLILLAGLALWLLPWQGYLITYAKEKAAEHGIIIESLELARLDTEGAEFTNVIILRKESETELVRVQADSIVASYSHQAVPRRATITSPQIVITQGKQQFMLADNVLEMEQAESGRAEGKGQFSAMLSHLAAPEETLFAPVILTVPFTVTESVITAQPSARETQLDALLETNYSFEREQGTQTLNNTRIAWQGGTINFSPMKLQEGAAITTNATIRNFSMEALLGLMTQDYISATGTLSGTLPLRFEGGTLVVGNGTLAAQSPGKLIIAPAYLNQLAAANPALQDIAGAFTNFDYTSLEIVFTEVSTQRTQVAMRVKGSNPATYTGRAIHLNISIGGDVHSLIMQSLQLEDLTNKLLSQ